MGTVKTATTQHTPTGDIRVQHEFVEDRQWRPPSAASASLSSVVGVPQTPSTMPASQAVGDVSRRGSWVSPFRSNQLSFGTTHFLCFALHSLHFQLWPGTSQKSRGPVQGDLIVAMEWRVTTATSRGITGATAPQSRQQQRCHSVLGPLTMARLDRAGSD